MKANVDIPQKLIEESVKKQLVSLEGKLKRSEAKVKRLQQANKEYKEVMRQLAEVKSKMDLLYEAMKYHPWIDDGGWV